MRHSNIRDQRKSFNSINRRLERLAYLPGAVILGYGLWLALTVNS
jgi:hypothetical protein